MISRQIEAVYDAVADRYAERFAAEFDHKPFDRAWLDRLAALASPLGPIADLGCGPGQVAAYLHRRGADVVGVDLSPAMLDQARRLHPGIEFRRDDLLDLTLPPASLGGIAAFYAIVNFDLDQVEPACRGLQRVLVPGGVALTTFHVGDEARQVDEFLGRPIAARLRAAGLEIEEVTVRPPYDGVEYPSERAYTLARKPDRPADDARSAVANP